MNKLLEQSDDMRRSGSAALDLAYVAAGRYDMYWELGIYPWDTAAGELLVRCAGGVATDFYGHADGIIGRRSMVAARTEALHHHVLHHLKSLQIWLGQPGFEALGES